MKMTVIEIRATGKLLRNLDGQPKKFNSEARAVHFLEKAYGNRGRHGFIVRAETKEDK